MILINHKYLFIRIFFYTKRSKYDEIVLLMKYVV